MADSEDEAADFSNALLQVNHIDDDSFDIVPNAGGKKIVKTDGGIDDLDFLSNDTPAKGKLNGSTFRNMGNLISRIVIYTRFRTFLA